MQDKAGVSLLFAAGARPSAEDVERAIDRTLPEASPGRDTDGLELLSAGRRFTVRGLAPGEPAPTPPIDHTCGLPADIGRFGFEAMSIVPADNRQQGEALLPLARDVLALAVGLGRELPLTAACWNPAGVWIEPRYFGRIVGGWLAGGAFPAHALTCLRSCGDGAVESTGLAFFTGQELRLEAGADQAASDAMQMAARLVDLLVTRAGLERSEAVPGLDDETWLLVPSADRRQVVAARR